MVVLVVVCQVQGRPKLSSLHSFHGFASGERCEQWKKPDLFSGQDNCWRFDSRHKNSSLTEWFINVKREKSEQETKLFDISVGLIIEMASVAV